MELREWRGAAGLTQGELALKAGVSRAAISHIENERYAPSAGFAGKVCRALGRELKRSLHTWMVFPQSFSSAGDN